MSILGVEGGMDIDRAALNTICNEARLVSVAIDPEARTSRIVLVPLRMGDSADEPITIELRNVGRVLASLRRGRWDDRRAAPVPLDLASLLSLLAHCGQDIYGDIWDEPVDRQAHWATRISYEWAADDETGRAHRVDLFHNPPEGHLDLSLWFDEVVLLTADGQTAEPESVASEVGAWWAGVQSGAVPAGDHGIWALAPGQLRPWWRRLLRR